MRTQCVSVSDEQPIRQLLLKANCALHNTLRTENGRKNWNVELISPLFEKITTLHNHTNSHVLKEQQKKRHITQ